MRKAITPVIAIVLLMMMVVAASGVAYFWLTGLQSGVQSQIESGVSGSVQGGLSRLNIISSSCSGTSLSVNIQNAGQSTITNGTIAVTINDNTGATIETITGSLGGDLSANSIRTIGPLTVSNAFTSGQAYALTLTLPTGSQQTTTCLAP